MSLLSKGVQEGIKLFRKYDGKFEEFLDEAQGIDNTVIGKTASGKLKFTTPGATATNRGAVVGTDRTRAFGKTKAIKGGTYTLGGLGLIEALASLMTDDDEEEVQEEFTFEVKGLAPSSFAKGKNLYSISQLPEEGASIIEGNDFTMYANSKLKQEAANAKGKTFKFSGDNKRYNVEKILRTFENMERQEFSLGGMRTKKSAGSKIIDFGAKLAEKGFGKAKNSFMKREFLRDMANDPEFDEAIDNLPENEFVDLMDEIGFDYDMGMGPMTGGIDIAMQLDPEDAAKNYMAFEGFDNVEQYLKGKSPAEIRLFIKTLVDDPDYGEVDARVVSMAERVLKGKTNLRELKNQGGQANKLRNALSEEDSEAPFPDRLSDEEKETLGEFPTIGQVRQFRADRELENQRRLQQAVDESNRQGYAEGGFEFDYEDLKRLVEISKERRDNPKPRLSRNQPFTINIDGKEYTIDPDKRGKSKLLEKNKNVPLTVEIEGKTFTVEPVEMPRLGQNEGGMPVDTYPNIPPEEMEAAMASQLPDEQMEDEYIDFVMDKSLSEDDQNYLAVRLEEDPRLSDILDSIVLTAGEFTGAGAVEGPGTGVSDSIPARLSDGEFVFTRKATDQLGAANLQQMMDDAERAYDGGYQRKAVGGYMFDDPRQSEIASPSSIDEEIKKAMIGSNKIPSLQ